MQLSGDRQAPVTRRYVCYKTVEAGARHLFNVRAPVCRRKARTRGPPRRRSTSQTLDPGSHIPPAACTIGSSSAGQRTATIARACRIPPGRSGQEAASWVATAACQIGHRRMMEIACWIGSLETTMIPLTAPSISKMRKIAPATEAAHTSKTMTIMPLRGAL